VAINPYLHPNQLNMIICNGFNKNRFLQNYFILSRCIVSSSFILHHFSVPISRVWIRQAHQDKIYSSFILHHFSVPDSRVWIRQAHQDKTYSSFILHHFSVPVSRVWIRQAHQDKIYLSFILYHLSFIIHTL